MPTITCAYRISSGQGFPFRHLPAVGSLSWKEPLYTPEQYGSILDIVFSLARGRVRMGPESTRVIVGRIIAEKGFTVCADHVNLMCEALDNESPEWFLHEAAQA